MREKRFIPLALLVALAFVGCQQKPQAPKSGLPMVDMKVGSRNYHVEVASDEYSRMRGLMERDSLPDDHGMIFVFLQDTDEPFWMKNTRFPLDILFIDSGGKIISIGHMKPFDETNTLPGGMYRYAIELNAGRRRGPGLKWVIRLPCPRRRCINSLSEILESHKSVYPAEVLRSIWHDRYGDQMLRSTSA